MNDGTARQRRQGKLPKAKGGGGMMEFDLGVVPADLDLNSAFAWLFEDRHSALVVEKAKGDLELVNFDDLTDALARGASSLAQVNGRQLHNLERSERSDYTKALTRMDATFGLINVSGQRALLYSISESLALPLAAASSVLRCNRPGLPTGRIPQSWYHYYPPNPAPASRPCACTVKGCSGQVV
jgi:hypothetical protein